MKRLLVAIGFLALPGLAFAQQAETIEYYATDAIGSIRIVYDGTGNVIGRQDFTPFGTSIPVGTLPKEGFGGNEKDDETQQTYFHARSLATRTGRFSQPDAVQAGLFEPQRWNRYAYALSNPLRYTDRLGMSADPCDGTNYNTGTCVSASPINPEWQGNPYFCYWPCSGFGGSGGSGSGDRDRGGGGTSKGNGNNNGNDDQNNNPEDPDPTDQGNKVPLFQKRKDVPNNAYTCTADGNTFFAPPSFYLDQIVADGQAGGKSIPAMKRAVAQGGTYDFQRVRDQNGNITFYSAYTNVSNVAVGAYEFGAGFTRTEAGYISNMYAWLNSSNAGDPQQAVFRNLGYDMASGKVDYKCVVK